MNGVSSRVSRCTAAVAALTVILSSGPLPALAGGASAPPSSLSGRIFLADVRTPVRDAVVKAFNRSSEEIFESAVAGPDGAYRVDGLTPGEYDLGISTTSGIYLVEGSIKVAPGQKRAASFSLQPYDQEGAGRQTQSPQATSDDGDRSDGAGKEPEPGKPEKRRKLKRPRSATARTPLIATGVIVGGALVVGAIANNLNDDDGSPDR